jgi:hypothetical protein
MKYKTKPCEIEAIQFDGTNSKAIRKWMGHGDCEAEKHMLIGTLEGVMTASPMDYIIRGLNGEYYPCKPDIFEKKYAPVENPNDE